MDFRKKFRDESLQLLTSYDCSKTMVEAMKYHVAATECLKVQEQRPIEHVTYDPNS